MRAAPPQPAPSRCHPPRAQSPPRRPRTRPRDHLCACTAHLPRHHHRRRRGGLTVFTRRRRAHRARSTDDPRPSVPSPTRASERIERPALRHLAGITAMRHALGANADDWENHADRAAAPLIPDALWTPPEDHPLAGGTVAIEYDAGSYDPQRVYDKLSEFERAFNAPDLGGRHRSARRNAAPRRRATRYRCHHPRRPLVGLNAPPRDDRAGSAHRDRPSRASALGAAAESPPRPRLGPRERCSPHPCLEPRVNRPRIQPTSPSRRRQARLNQQGPSLG